MDTRFYETFSSRVSGDLSVYNCIEYALLLKGILVLRCIFSLIGLVVERFLSKIALACMCILLSVCVHLHTMCFLSRGML